MQVVKRYRSRYITAVERRLVHGAQQAAEELVAITQVGLDVFHTGYGRWLADSVWSINQLLHYRIQRE